MSSAGRARKILYATINGLPVMQELADFEPPEIKFKTVDITGGGFLGVKVSTGLEPLQATFNFKGMSNELMRKYMASEDGRIMIDVGASEEDEDGKDYAVLYSFSGKPSSDKEGKVSMDELPSGTLVLDLRIYMKEENKQIVRELNADTQTINLGDGDIMAKHKQNAGMPAGGA